MVLVRYRLHAAKSKVIMVVQRMLEKIYSASSLESPLLTFLLPLYVCVNIS